MNREDGLQIIRTSERGQFKRCRWQWERAYGDCIRPTVAAPALRFGTLVHGALEAYYKPGVKRGPHPAATFRKLYDAEVKRLWKFGWRDEDDKWQDAGDLGEAMMNHYVEHYGSDSEWKVLITEQRFQVPILNSRDKPLGIYTGIMDLVMLNRATKEVFVWDHKTAAAIEPGYLILDEQAGAYWTYGVEWLLQQGLIKPGARLDGMYFNFMRKAAKDMRPQNEHGQYLNKPEKAVLLAVYKREGRELPERRVNDDGRRIALSADDLIADLGDRCLQLGEVSKTQPSAYFHREPVYRDEYDRQMVRRRVLDEMRDMAAVREGRTVAYKSPSQINCRSCGYKDICELHETGQDWEAMASQTMEKWEPFDWVEIEAAELK